MSPSSRWTFNAIKIPLKKICDIVLIERPKILNGHRLRLTSHWSVPGDGCTKVGERYPALEQLALGVQRAVSPRASDYLLSMRCTLLGYSFEPRHKSHALGTVGSVITISLSINRYSHSKNQFDQREQDWLVHKLGLRWLQRFDVIQAEPPFLLLAKEGSALRLLLYEYEIWLEVFSRLLKI